MTPTPRQHTAKFQRKPPSAAEQARRVAWGRKYGPLVGGMIRAAIKDARQEG